MNGIVAQIGAWFVAVIVPMMATTLVAEAVDAIKPRDYHAIPALRRAALLAGLLLAIVVLWAGPPVSIYAIDRIFSVDSPWNLDFSAMVEERFGPYLRLLPDIYLRSYDSPLWIRATVAAHGILLLLALLLPFRLWGGVDAIRAAACDALIAVAATILPLYAVCAVYWLMNELSIWVVAVIGILFQRYRQQRYHYAAGRG
ncbi:MAG: hypothetical protein IT561_19895 [Alphaproteobacteria bacterium]|nr:hypothetical protein [Alphaproteobacteria bacterium]